MNRAIGPWFTSGYYSYRFEDDEEVRRVIEVKQRFETRPPDARIICEVNEQGGDEISHAHLITAAPELLDAAKQIYEWWKSYPGATGAPAAMFNLTAAIAKAEGTPSAVEKSQADGSQKPNEAKL
jgi:hypothetical protein